MSVRFDNSTDILRRTSDLPDDETFTACGWAYRSVDTNDYASIFALEGTETPTDGYLILSLGSTGDNVDLYYDVSGTSDSDLAFFTPTHPVWFFWSVTVASLTATARCAELGDTSFTVGTATQGSHTYHLDDYMTMGENEYGTEPLNGRVSAVKIWSGAALTADQLWNEMQSFRPQEWNNLHLWSSMLDDGGGAPSVVRDYSGNGRNWSIGGSLAYEPDPPISWGAAPIIVGVAPAAAPTAKTSSDTSASSIITVLSYPTLTGVKSGWAESAEKAEVGGVTSKSDSDSGAWTSSTALTASAAPTDSGSWDELATEAATLASSDSSAWVESVALVKAYADTGVSAWAESQSETAAYGQSDTAASQQAVSTAAAYSVTDSGAWAESAIVDKALSVSDASAFADSASPETATAAPSDTAAWAVATSQAYGATVSDTSAWAETPSPAQGISVSDTGSWAESVSVEKVRVKTDSDTSAFTSATAETATAAPTDTAAWTETTAGAYAIALSDTGAWNETATVEKDISLSDAGAWAESVGVTESASPVDSAAFSSTTTQTAVYSQSDSSAWAETESLDQGSVSKADTDTAAWAESTTLEITASATDTAAFASAVSETAVYSETDTGAWAETQVFNAKGLAVSDTGSWAETESVEGAGDQDKTNSDTASWAESALSGGQSVSVSETAGWGELATVVATYTTTDTSGSQEPTTAETGTAVPVDSGAWATGTTETATLTVADLSDVALRLPGSDANSASTPHSAGLSIAADIDLRIRMAANDWSPASNVTLLLKRDPASNLEYGLLLGTTGVPTLVWYDGGAITVGASTNVNFANGSIKWLRATLDADNGASQKVITFYTSDDGSSWTQFGTQQVVAGTTTIDGSPNAALYVGTDAGFDYDDWPGRVYRAQVYDGIGGTLVFDAEFDQEETGTTSFTESSAQSATVTINQSGDPFAFIGRSRTWLESVSLSGQDFTRSDVGAWDEAVSETAALTATESHGWTEQTAGMDYTDTDTSSWAESGTAEALGVAKSDTDASGWQESVALVCSYSVEETSGATESTSTAVSFTVQTDTSGWTESAELLGLFSGTVRGSLSLGARAAGTASIRRR